MSFFDGVTKALKKHNEYINTYSDVDNYVDTGSYALNALVSGSIFGGFPNNKIIALAGESSTGKTYFTLGIIQQFLRDNPTGGVLYYETEDAITEKMLIERGIDPDRVITVPVSTVQEFKHLALIALGKYTELKEEDRPPMMMCLDSLGMLSTTKEMEDSAEGKETKDMTRAQLVKATFRVLTLKLGKAKVPLVLTNHTYQTMGMFSTKEMSGGSGLRYAADYIVYLSRKKEKDGTEVVGHVIHCLNNKSRLTKENKKVDVLLRYDTGLHRYYGLSDIALAAGIFKKLPKGIELPDGTKTTVNVINKNPKKYFTEDIMKRIDEACEDQFMYGSSIVEEEKEDGNSEK